MAAKDGLPDIAYTQPDRLIKYRVSEDGFEAEVLLPGLWYTDFDKKIGGKVTVWSISKIFESIRYSVLDNGFGQFNRLKDEDHSIFLASVTYDFTRKMHSLTGGNYWGRYYPLLAKLNIVSVGKSSFTFDTKIHNHNTGEELIVAYLTFVYVDYKTRKPSHFPSWFKEIAKSKMLSPPPARLPTPDIPKSAYTYTTRAYASDIDINGHVNSSMFLKWCADAGADAAIKGHYSGFTEDIGKYPNKQIAIKYIGEGMQGDQFVVHTWQDDKDKAVIHFAITRDDKIVFASRFSYFSRNLSSRL